MNEITLGRYSVRFAGDRAQALFQNKIFFEGERVRVLTLALNQEIQDAAFGDDARAICFCPTGGNPISNVLWKCAPFEIQDLARSPQDAPIFRIIENHFVWGVEVRSPIPGYLFQLEKL
jgi:hypothetical protein